MTERYRFSTDTAPEGWPVRDTWEEAAEDCVGAGYGTWHHDKREMVLDDYDGAKIEIVHDD